LGCLFVAVDLIESSYSFPEELFAELRLATSRDWRRVNEGLVKRGEILLDLRILDRRDSVLSSLKRTFGGRLSEKHGAKDDDQSLTIQRPHRVNRKFVTHSKGGEGVTKAEDPSRSSYATHHPEQ